MAENKAPKLSPRRERVIQHYCDPESPTFSSVTQSTLREYPNMLESSAASHGSRLIKKAQTDGSLDRYMADYHETTRVRMGVLQDVALGRHVSESVVEHEDESGTLTHKQRTKSTPTAMAIVRANDTLAKLDGTYARQALTREAVSMEYRTIVERQRREISKARSKSSTT